LKIAGTRGTSEIFLKRGTFQEMVEKYWSMAWQFTSPHSVLIYSFLIFFS
jgi:hypothetical protein